MIRRALLVVSSIIFVLSCASPQGDGPLGVSVQWGLTGTTALPSSVVNFRVVTCVVDPDTGDEDCGRLEGGPGSSTTCSVAGLTRMREAESCRPTMGTDQFGDEPVLVRRDLPTGTPIRILLHGMDEAGAVTHTGQLGPFVLGVGERRQLTVRMWPVGEGAVFAGESLGRFLHTTSWLPDGRLLVAGGFNAITDATCPGALPAGSSCFRATATDSAMAIDVSSGQVEPLRGTMLAARGGHTATTLPDGRILLVGGATEALLAFSPIGMETSGRFEINILPLDADGASTAHASFELFDAFIGHRSADPDRNGDLGRGGFIGVGGTTELGAINQPRFLHAAAATPGRPGRVLIAGGMGSADAPQTFEVFDADKPGGYGFYRAGAGNRMVVARPAPSAVGLGDTVWIFGGGVAEDNTQMAELWTAGEMPNGSIELASDAGAFPDATLDAPAEHPEYSLIRPMAVAVGAGHALVMGWYGARCLPDMSTEVFTSPVPTEFCNSPTPPRTRSFTVDSSNGLAIPTEVRPQAFGEVAVTHDFDMGDPDARTRIVAIGGVANSTWSPQRSAEVFDGTVRTTGTAAKALGTGVALMDGRFFHTATGVPGLGVVSVGGVQFSSRGGLSLVDRIEVFWIGS